MKYVRPYALFKQIEKRNVELAQRKAIRAQLLGFNVLDDYVTVAISDTAMERVKHYGLLERKRRNVHTIANAFRTLIPKYNLEGVVIGCPDAKNYNLEGAMIGCLDAKNIENREVAKVLSFVYDLCNTGKLEGFKYTCWDWRFGPKMYLHDCRRKLYPEDYNR